MVGVIKLSSYRCTYIITYRSVILYLQAIQIMLSPISELPAASHTKNFSIR